MLLMIDNAMPFIKIISSSFTQQLLKKCFHNNYKYMSLCMIIFNPNICIYLILLEFVHLI